MVTLAEPKTDPCPKCGQVDWIIKNYPKKNRRGEVVRYDHWKCRRCRNDRMHDKRRRIKDEVIEAYGGRCTCCGITRRVFLSLDHINNDGAAHRVALRGHRMATSDVYRWARQNGYPPNLQVLCHNCNQAKQIEGDSHSCERDT